ncbi:response regulator [Mucilaginibacter sp. Bleaf8]|uniref:hybrid sensor histidine kinase/response regulator transcription factor n=1 Tax=Mucilaginibacter sp. Bleaf8 TaxID=2834430 RepID=UPI001BCEE4D0|nr:hybrid sensor histidine kinase/response regulator transcription factor [Mucilaginibacter sp. Bleaf8]MBS7564796.1 response regulator [Mucilaginibacter sp. Bleaf8]
MSLSKITSLHKGESCVVICAVIFTIIFSFGVAKAQPSQFRFKHLTVDEGLSHTDANYITQDLRGFIWIATYFGLNRYDGYTVKKFYNNNKPVNNAFKNRIRCLFASHRNQIWLGTEGGIQRFDPGTETYIDYRVTGTTGFTAEKIWMPDSRTMYVLAGGRLLKFQINGHSLVCRPTGIPESTIVYDFTSLSAKELLVATANGLITLDSQGAVLKVSLDRLLPVTIKCLFIDHQNNLVLAGMNYIYSAVRQAGGRSYQIKDSVLVPGGNPVTQIVRDATGDFWVKASPNVLRLDSKLKLIQTIKAGPGNHDLNSASLSDMLIDRSQCLWIATFGRGVNYCDLNQKQFHTFQHDPENANSLSGNYVRSILAQQNTLWVGTMEKGLNRYDIASQTFRHFSSAGPLLKLKNDNVLSLAMDKNKRLWIGSHAGIQVINPVTLRNCSLIGEKEFPHFMIENLAEDCFGNMWFGNHTNRFGVIWKDDDNAYHVRFFGEGYFILPDKKKPEMLVSSTHGLNRYQIDRFGQILQSVSYQANGTGNSLSSNYIYPVSKQNDSIYWVGTIGGGLNRLTLQSNNRYHIEQYNKYFDIFKDVEAMETDQQGNVWMGGNGLEFLNLSKRTLVKFNKDDGLQGNSFKVGSSFKGPDGKLYFGGIDGLTFFDPKEIVTNSIPAKPVITDILINNQHPVYTQGHQNNSASTEALMNGSPLTFNYQQNNFVISFSAMHFPNALKSRYRYKLVGYDKSWIYTDGSKPSAFYSNLDYNDYRFIVQATNNDGLWSRDEAVLLLTITPPWWKSVPAKAGYTILLLTILAGIYIYQARWYRLKKDMAVRAVNEAKREEMHQHREELYQQQLLFFTNISHEFRTPLTLIIGPLEALLKENEDSLLQSSYHMMLRNAKRLINLITELMNFKKIADSVIRLQVQQLDVREFCKGIAAEFDDIAVSRLIDFQFKDTTQTPPEQELKGWFDVQVLEKIIYNLLNNAFKYTNVKGSVVFEVYTDPALFQPKYNTRFQLKNEEYRAEKYIYFRVADTGIGISEESITRIFDRYYRISNNHLGSGIGLALVKSLTQLHKGDINVFSERNQGTEIIIAIPWGESNYTLQERINSVPAQSAQLELVDNSVLVPAVTDEKPHPPIPRAGKSILIVDDNAELRLFLRQVLEKDYKIIEAEDGQKAIEITLENIPNLIISDIMMPLMDGIEFSRSIKERFETRHIPIILLSAKDALDTKIAGLESGADFYFAKPLSVDLLLLTIQNIFHQHAILKETYTNNYLSEATELVSSEKDKEFMNKLLNTIEENIENTDLDVDFLCKHLYVSRTKLYQKIKSISDQSVAEFIRTVRLKRSIFIMTHEDITMSEVADRVGLQSSSNFSRAFKKEYGKSPMQFMQSLKNV